MGPLITALLFAFLLGLFFGLLHKYSANYELNVFLVFACIVVVIAFGIKVNQARVKSVARQHLLESKCIQAGLARMIPVTTEERFEFIENSTAAAEQNNH